MKKLILGLVILAQLSLSAMYDGSFYPDLGHIPTAEELVDGYVPTDADFKAGYVPTLDEMQTYKQFKKIHSIGARVDYEATLEDNSPLVIAFKNGVFNSHEIFPPEIPRKQVFGQHHIPTKQELSDGYRPDFSMLNANDNFKQQGNGMCFKSLHPNADGAITLIWLHADGSYDDCRFKYGQPESPAKSEDKEARIPGAKLKSASVPNGGLFAYIRQNKLKFGIGAGLLAVLTFVISKYNKSTQKVAA